MIMFTCGVAAGLPVAFAITAWLMLTDEEQYR
jgi:hypothetical protein